MISVLDMLQAWEKQTKESEDTFWEKLKHTTVNNPRAAVGMAYQRCRVRFGKPSEDCGAYHRHGGVFGTSLSRLEAHPGAARSVENRHWKSGRVAGAAPLPYGVYSEGSSTKASHRKPTHLRKRPRAGARLPMPTPIGCSIAPQKDCCRRSAGREIHRAVGSREPVPQIYDAMILDYERAGNLAVALDWTEQSVVCVRRGTALDTAKDPAAA